MRIVLPALLIACSTLLSCGGDTGRPLNPRRPLRSPRRCRLPSIKHSTFHVVTTGVDARIAAFFAEEVAQDPQSP